MWPLYQTNVRIIVNIIWLIFGLVACYNISQGATNLMQEYLYNLIGSLQFSNFSNNVNEKGLVINHVNSCIVCVHNTVFCTDD